MATTYSGDLGVSFSCTETATQTGSISMSGAVTWSYSKIITTGTTSGKFNCAYFIQETIAGAGTTSVNLNTGLKDMFGNALVYARLNFMYFNLLSTAAGGTAASSISIGNDAQPLNNWISNVLGTININNDGIFFIGDVGTTGYPVSGGTNDTILITNNDAGVSAVVNHVYLGKSA